MSKTPQSRTIVLIHGAWVTPASWAEFRQPFEAAGYTVHTPTWPLLDGLSPAEINASPPAGFGALTVGKVVDHLQRFIEGLPQQPILIGHSYGGLYTQLLLDRGVGVAGVALNPVLIGGIVPGPVTLTAALPILARPNGWNRPYAFSRERWFRRFANSAPRALSDEAYDSYVIPAPGRIFYQAAGMIGTGVNVKARKQPLLVLSAGHAAPAIIVFALLVAATLVVAWRAESAAAAVGAAAMSFSPSAAIRSSPSAPAR